MIILINSCNKIIYPVLDPEKKTKISWMQSLWIIFVCYNLQRNRKKKILIYMFQCFVVENRQKLEGRKNITTYLAYERNGVQINRPIFLYKC